MKKIEILEDGVVVELTKSELAFLNNAVLETLEALEDWEFHARTGANPEFAYDLLNQFKSLKKELTE